MLSKDILQPMELYVVNELENYLDSFYINFFIELCVYKKYKVAYENLCMQINEFDIKIHRNLFNHLKMVCSVYGLSDNYYKHIEHLISWG